MGLATKCRTNVTLTAADGLSARHSHTINITLSNAKNRVSIRSKRRVGQKRVEISDSASRCIEAHIPDPIVPSAQFHLSCFFRKALVEIGY